MPVILYINIRIELAILTILVVYFLVELLTIRHIFFNNDDIEKVWFTGYIDENELKAQKVFKEQIDKIEYPHFTIEEVNKIEE